MTHTLLTIFVALLSLACASPSSAGSEPLVIGHRGNVQTDDENTVRSILEAQHADMVEVDVRWTRTHVPVLMHDVWLGRTTTGTGRVARRTWSYLKQHRTEPRGRRIPLLRTACRRTTVPLLVHIKADHDLTRLLQIVKDDCPSGTMIMPRAHNDDQWRQVSSSGLQSVVLVRSADQGLYQAEYGATVAHVRRDLLNPDMLERVADAELQLWTWTHRDGDPADWLSPFADQVSGYTTDRP